MAKGPYDDIVRKVLERLSANAPKATAKTTKSVGRKAASVPAKTMTKAERSAANKAAHAAGQAKLMAKRAAERPAQKAARTAESSAKGTARANRATDAAYGGSGATDIKIDKAKAYYENEVEKLNRTIDVTERKLSRGSQGRRDMLKKDLEQFKKRYDLPSLSAGDSLGVVRQSLARAKEANRFAKKRLEQLVKQTEGKNFKETVQMGARRARVIENETGKKLTGKKPDYVSASQKDLNKRMVDLRRKQMQDKLIKKADSKMGTSSGPRKKVNKPFVKTKSEIALERAQAKNAKKSVVDPKVARMTDVQRQKLVADTIKEKNRLKNVKVSGRGYTDAEAKAKLAALGEREMGGSSRLRSKKAKPKPSPEGLRKQFSNKK
jgi:hypothetical protein